MVEGYFRLLTFTLVVMGFVPHFMHTVDWEIEVGTIAHLTTAHQTKVHHLNDKADKSLFFVCSLSVSVCPCAYA